MRRRVNTSTYGHVGASRRRRISRFATFYIQLEEKLKTRETEIQEIKTELQELLSLVTEDSPYSD